MYRQRLHIPGLFLVSALALLASCKSKKEAAALQQQPPPGQAAESPEEVSFGFLYINGCTERMKGNLQQAMQIFEECRKLRPQDAAVNYELGTINKLLGNNDKALAHAKICAAADPMNEWYQLLLIDCYNTQRQYTQAIKVRESLVKNFPDRNEFKEDLAIEYAVAGQYDKSYKIYEQLEKSYGLNEQITLNKVKLLKSQHKNREAEQELLKLSESDKSSTQYYIYLAEFYSELNQAEKAKQMYDKILALEPANPAVNLALYDYYNTSGQADEGFKYLKKAFENADLDIKTKAGILTEYYKSAELGNKKAAEAGLELAKMLVTMYPSATESNGIYADFLRLDRKPAEAAAYYYRAAVNERRNYGIWRNLLYVDNELARFDSLERHSAQYMDLFPTLPEGYLYNGLANTQLKNYKKAAQSLKDGQEFVMDNQVRLDFLKSMGDAYFYMKDYAQSDRSFDEALKIDPDNTYVLNNYAYYLSLRSEGLDKAEKYSRRANDLKPGNRSYMDTYGWILFMQKKYSEAEIWLGKAASAGTPNATLLEHHGDVLYRLNRPAEALQQWNAAQKAGGSSEALLKKIKQKRLDD